jgi:preprotein translocase subunit SecA
LRKDEDYVISGGDIVLVDPITGRARPDSRYQHGLQAALEAKEGVAVRTESEVLAQISVQGYVRQYSSIAGMTGTALGSEDEFRNIYGIRVTAVPPTHGSRRVDLPTRLYGSRRDKLDAVLDQVRLCHRVGRPVLVGTVTVEQSEEISALLSLHGIEHRVLNAVTNADEAQIVRAAGRSGAVTVATNMAGRGTDIVLESGLDTGIVQRFVELVEELLTEGGGQIAIKCGSAEEADMLEGTLASRDRPLNIAIERKDVVIVASFSNELRRESADIDDHANIVPQTGKVKMGPRPLSLEFGLGLAVIATEMNDSGRIDRQLRGRGGRQAGFGSSRFILSREDKGLALQSHAAESRDRPPDSSGRAFKESRANQRRLDRIQSRMELEDETGRAAMADYHRVLEEQTLNHYRARLAIIDSGSFHVACVEFIRQAAHRIVTRYYPPASSWDYANRFDGMAEEAWLDYGVDCRPLRGLGIDDMPAELADLMADRLEQARAATGEQRYDVIEKVSFLQTADELWRDHLVYLDELMVGTMLCSPGHRTAVAEYHFCCLDAYRRYEREVIDRFLPRLLRVDTAEDAATSIASEGGLVEDLHEILV